MDTNYINGKALVEKFLAKFYTFIGAVLAEPVAPCPEQPTNCVHVCSQGSVKVFLVDYYGDQPLA